MTATPAGRPLEDEMMDRETLEKLARQVWHGIWETAAEAAAYWKLTPEQATELAVLAASL